MFRHIFMFISWTVWLIKTYTLKKKKRKHNEGELPQSGKGKIDMQVQVAQGVPKKLDPRRNTPRHIIIKLSKIKDKERILKAAREGSYLQTSSHKTISWCLKRNLAGKKGRARSIWSPERQELTSKLLYPAKLSFRMGGQIQCFPDKVKLKEFIITKPL